MAALFFSLPFLLLPFARPRQRRRAGDNFNYGPRRVPRTPSTLGGAGGRGGSNAASLTVWPLSLGITGRAVYHSHSQRRSYLSPPSSAITASPLDGRDRTVVGWRGEVGGEGVGRAVESKRKRSTVG